MPGSSRRWRSANQLYEQLSAAEQVAAKRLFVSLVTPGEGREDTRARTTLPADPTTTAVIEAFAGPKARLIVTGDAAGSRSAEVSHEALIRHWERLRDWVDDNRQNLRTRAALVAGRSEWLKQNRHRSLLIEPDLRLEAARRLRDQPGDVVIDDIKDYIDASLARDTRRRLWRNLSLAAAILVAMVMAGLAGLAVNRQYEAERGAAIAVENETRALAALSDAALGKERYPNAVKLALAAWPRSAEDMRPKLRATINALGNAQRYQRQLVPALRHERSVFGGVGGAAFSRDGSRILSWADDNTVRLWDAATGRELVPALRHDEGGVGGGPRSAATRAAS